MKIKCKCGITEFDPSWMRMKVFDSIGYFCVDCKTRYKEELEK